jgi:PAS domain S-box-containing protein
MGRAFTPSEIADVVESLEYPSLATRGPHIVAVNDRWLRDFGYPRDEVVGASIERFLVPEERDRLLKRSQLPEEQVTFGQPLATVALAGDGRPIPVQVFTSRFLAEEPPHFRVLTIVADATAKREVNLARDLLTLSAELIGSPSEAQVRGRTEEGLRRLGLRGEFWTPTRPARPAEEGASPDANVDATTAHAALEAHRPIFAGPRSTMPEAVYLPLDDEVLVVSGHHLDGQQSYALGFFAKLLATALLDARSAAIAQRKLEGTQLLLQVAHTTSKTLDLDTVLSAAAESLVRLLDVSSCVILRYDEEARALRGAASSLGRRDVVSDIMIPIDDPDSVAATAARDLRMLVIPDTQAHPLARRASRVHAFQEAAIVAAPIVTRGRLGGVVVLDDTRGPRAFTPEWIALATAIVAQVGLPISNARLYESLRRSYAELEDTRAAMVKRERLAALGELAAIVAHEVRNPLGVIVNATSSLSKIVAGTPEGNTLLHIVRATEPDRRRSHRLRAPAPALHTPRGALPGPR